MRADAFAGCRTIMWYDQYCENYYARGFKAYTPEAVMRDLDRIDSDVYAIYAANQWGLAYYDSDVIPRHASLSADYFGEVVAALRARGKKVIGYINWLTSRHPEWSFRRLTSDGTVQPLPHDLVPLPEYEVQGKGTVYKLRYGEWFNPCINSPRRQEIAAVARELVARYPLDGLHLDMFFNWGICVCDHCRPKLEALLGTSEITYQGICEHWGEYLSWRQAVSTEFTREMAAIAHAADVSYTPNAFCPLFAPPTMAVSPGWWEQIDNYVTEAWLRLTQDYADTHSTTLVCKWLRALDKPGMVLVTGQHPGFSHAPLAEAEYHLHAAGALSNGRPILGSCGQGAYPSTASSQEAVHIMGRVFADYTAAASGPARQTVKHVAVLWSEATRAFYEPGDDTLRYRYEFLGYCRALAEGHIIYDMVLPERLHTAADLEGYELLILPNVACMDEALAEVVRSWVTAGGKLLCTWDTGLCDPIGQRRSESLLGDVLGLRYVEPYPYGTFYWERELEPAVCVGGAARVEPTTAEVLAWLVEPDPDYPDVGTGLDLVPGERSPYPLLARNAYGQGTAWYVAGSLGYAAYQTGYYQVLRLLDELLASMGLDVWYSLDAPASVELSMERDEEGTLYVHLANQTVPAYLPGRRLVRSIDGIIPLHDIWFRLYGQVVPEDVVPMAGLQVSACCGGIACHLDRLEDYQLIRVRGWRR